MARPGVVHAVFVSEEPPWKVANFRSSPYYDVLDVSIMAPSSYVNMTIDIGERLKSTIRYTRLINRKK